MLDVKHCYFFLNYKGPTKFVKMVILCEYWPSLTYLMRYGDSVSSERLMTLWSSFLIVYRHREFTKYELKLHIFL